MSRKEEDFDRLERSMKFWNKIADYRADVLDNLINVIETEHGENVSNKYLNSAIKNCIRRVGKNNRSGK